MRKDREFSPKVWKVRKVSKVRMSKIPQKSEGGEVRMTSFYDRL